MMCLHCGWNIDKEDSLHDKLALYADVQIERPKVIAEQIELFGTQRDRQSTSHSTILTTYHLVRAFTPNYNLLHRNSIQSELLHP